MELKIKEHTILFDAEDYDKLKEYGWYVVKGRKTHYVRAHVPGMGRENERKIYMHRLVMDNPDGVVDHEDRNGLNNQKLNLKSVTHGVNLRNGGAYKNSKTGVRGVQQSGKSFVSFITINRKSVYLGTFKTVKEASDAYKKALLDLDRG